MTVVQSVISKQTDEEIARLFKEGMGVNIIGRTLGLKFNSVCQRIKRMRDAGTDLPGQFERKQKLCIGSKAELDPRRASILHLLDLKRARHSPTQTEFQITSERPVAARSYNHHGSLAGSPAAMCEASW